MEFSEDDVFRFLTEACGKKVSGRAKTAGQASAMWHLLSVLRIEPVNGIESERPVFGSYDVTVAESVIMAVREFMRELSKKECVEE